MNNSKDKIMLTIAGSDSSAGAGIQADLKSGAAIGVYVATAITAITAQNSLGVTNSITLTGTIIRDQINNVCSDMNVAAIKCGMLPSIEAVDAVYDAIIKYKIPFLVVDPVMISTSGFTLIPNNVAEYIVEKLFPIATIVTPNIFEAQFISGKKLDYSSHINDYIDYFKTLGSEAVLLKGGHIDGNKLTDKLIDYSSGREYDFTFDKINTPNTHGTGCSLSSSIASFLTKGLSLHDSVNEAEIYIHKAIESGADRKLGEGHASIDHFFMLKN